MAEISVGDHFVVEQKRKRRTTKVHTTLLGPYTKKDAEAVRGSIEKAYYASKPHPFDFYMASVGKLAEIIPPEE